MEMLERVSADRFNRPIVGHGKSLENIIANADGLGFERQWQVIMKATIFHNPVCGTSRKTLDILETEGADVTIIEYLKTPPSRDELVRLYNRAGITPRQGLRAKEPLASELGLETATDEQILDAMVAYPILINRPLVETAKGVKLCRPQDEVRALL